MIVVIGVLITLRQKVITPSLNRSQPQDLPSLPKLFQAFLPPVECREIAEWKVKRHSRQSSRFGVGIDLW